MQTPSNQLPSTFASSEDGIQSTAVDSDKQREAEPANADLPSGDQPLFDALETYLNALLLHYVSGTFLATIKANHG